MLGIMFTHIGSHTCAHAYHLIAIQSTDGGQLKDTIKGYHPSNES